MAKSFPLIFIFLFGFICFAKSQENQTKDSISRTNTPSEIFPEYPGGNSELIKFVNKNRQYEGKDKRNVGTVFVRFIVEKDGSITEPEIARGFSEYYNKEAIRIIGLMPKWIPGSQNGRPVRILMNVPIKF